jgi:Mycothiol maleylpyruvate isomerase N-terminal domain
MKIESPAFTMDDVKGFIDTYADRERHLLGDRLQLASDRLAALGPHVAKQVTDDSDWTAHELLAHLAVLSKFYGVMVHRVAGGKLLDMDLLQAVNMRDAAGREMSERDPGEILRMTLADHERTIKALRTADPAALRRSARVSDDLTMTAEEIARLPLISHLEMHIDELEKLLGR